MVVLVREVVQTHDFVSAAVALHCSLVHSRLSAIDRSLDSSSAVVQQRNHPDFGA